MYRITCNLSDWVNNYYKLISLVVSEQPKFSEVNSQQWDGVSDREVA